MLEEEEERKKERKNKKKLNEIEKGIKNYQMKRIILKIVSRINKKLWKYDSLIVKIQNTFFLFYVFIYVIFFFTK